jgi:hypothetical protein
MEVNQVTSNRDRLDPDQKEVWDLMKHLEAIRAEFEEAGVPERFPGLAWRRSRDE